MSPFASPADPESVKSANERMSSRYETLEKLKGDMAECQKKDRFLLSFPADLEALFHADTISARQRRLFYFSLLSIFFFDIFALVDAQIIPDVFPIASVLRFSVATPICLGLSVLLLLPQAKRFVDLIASLNNLVGSVTLAVIFSLSSHPNAQHFHIGVLPIVLYANIVMRIRFRYACLVSIGTLLVHYAMISRADSISAELQSLYSSVMVISIVISLIATYQLELDTRGNYLRQLSDELQALQLQRSRDEMERISTHDALTGLRNRRYFDRRLESEWEAACVSGASLSLAFIDVDDFKAYNDHFGHQGGDACLRTVALAIEDSLQRSGDLCARYGGEEFVVLLPNAENSTALEIAERIRSHILEQKLPHPRARAAEWVTASIGVATTRPDVSVNIHDLVERADRALYRAKAMGRNQVHADHG